MSKRMDANKGKYPPYNWHKPIDINSLKQAVARHHTQFQLGNYEDDGQPYGHILGIACNLMMIYYQLTAYKPLTKEEIQVLESNLKFLEKLIKPDNESKDWYVKAQVLYDKKHEEYIKACIKKH